ncbi:MAG TPA: outer membrane beta-barrel family protein, partial [Ferruginibacter sp.]|nr:outer membrane beta-barrel family protein [Ferruginibacter sp.]
RNSYNITLLFNSNDNAGNGITEYSNINRFGNLYKLSNRNIISDAESYSPSASISYTHKGKDPAETFKINGGFNITHYDNARNFYQQYLNPDYSWTGNDSLQQQNSIVKSHNFYIRLNYDRPLKASKIFLGAGATLNRLVSHNSLQTAFMKKPENIFLNNELLSNNFKFFQDIYGVRVSLRYQFNINLFANAGVLTEYANTSFDIVNNMDSYANHYVSLLPFVNITRKWESGINITGSYKRSVQRPGINNLNPSIDYADPYNTRFGNPFLKPYFADNFDLGTGYWNKSYNINLAIGYNVLTQIYSSIRSLQPDGKTTTTWENLSGRKEYEASIWGGATISKKAKANASMGYTYNVYSIHDRMVNKYRNGGSIHSSLNSTYQFNTLLNANGNVTWHRFANPQGTVRNAISMNIGIQQKLLKKNMTISFNVIDPFYRLQNKIFINAPNYSLQSNSTSNSRNFRVSVGYTFKKAVKKKLKVKN